MAFDGFRVQYYKGREHEVREIADRCHSDELREQLEHVADQYALLIRQIKEGLLSG